MQTLIIVTVHRTVFHSARTQRTYAQCTYQVYILLGYVGVVGAFNFPGFLKPKLSRSFFGVGVLLRNVRDLS
jgi:hypothetical protein